MLACHCWLRASMGIFWWSPNPHIQGENYGRKVSIFSFLGATLAIFCHMSAHSFAFCVGGWGSWHIADLRGEYTRWSSRWWQPSREHESLWHTACDNGGGGVWPGHLRVVPPGNGLALRDLCFCLSLCPCCAWCSCFVVLLRLCSTLFS